MPMRVTFFQSLIRALESVRRIADAFNRVKIVNECTRLIKKIEN